MKAGGFDGFGVRTAPVSRRGQTTSTPLSLPVTAMGPEYILVVRLLGSWLSRKTWILIPRLTDPFPLPADRASEILPHASHRSVFALPVLIQACWARRHARGRRNRGRPRFQLRRGGNRG